MRAEDLKEWLCGMENKEMATKKRESEYEGAGNHCRLLVKRCEHVWETGKIPRQMILVIVVLVPKGNSDGFRRIGLLEVIWKLLERVLGERLSEIVLHNVCTDSVPIGAVAPVSWR